MVVTLIIVCEVAFWVLLAAGLVLRYPARKPRLGAAVLLCEPLLEVVLLAVTAIDLRNGAEGDWKHGLAAVYIGFTVAYGHYMVKWADGHFAHRFAGGPPPVRPPKYGMARAVHEWKMCARSVLGAVIALALLQGAVWYVGDAGRSESLTQWQHKMLFVIGISVVIAASYTLWPKKPKTPSGEPRDPAGARPAGREAAGRETAGH
ncbi:hypothetical protein [Streptomyces pini]|uniref:Uncharacterized protein n=1 Tax=Streptomyces pini TaxID=1520580 RepID=A0A1I3V6X2_9ACTN|nr:hypothetical protein [Streptomyces pini]SFJ90076.1 hypothetical protein SAMN05192584_102125 [Streptomyces pini]